MLEAATFQPTTDRQAKTEVPRTEELDTLVIGGGQAGLAVGHELSLRGVPYVILDAERRTGDGWRRRWDSLRLFTPARFSGLAGMPFPSHPSHFPTKDEFADYLESYVQRFALPVRHGVRVDRLSHDGERFVIEAGRQRMTADQVVVAMANYQQPKVPSFAADLDQEIVQLHSSHYRNPDQLPSGSVLVVGSGNSGAEIALELSADRQVFVAGRYPGHLPFEVDSPAGHAFLGRLVLRVLFHRVLTVATPLGRKAKPAFTRGSMPLIRTKGKHLDAAGVTRLSRVAGVRQGRPLLEDGSVLDVDAVVWCTGYRSGFEWIDLPLNREPGAGGHDDEPDHRHGVAAAVDGLYFVGLHYLYAVSSAMIHGVGRDAARIARAVAERRAEGATNDAPERGPEQEANRATAA